ncbi:hypothetical protein [Thermotoga petrophila]|uniref:hypothetical protein n=1 Tax=Thermotoga petrophila TaxID=93929 RepID=UPI001FC98E8A|nr:hypothetical protein [Thermotoga petrophila]
MGTPKSDRNQFTGPKAKLYNIFQATPETAGGIIMGMRREDLIIFSPLTPLIRKAMRTPRTSSTGTAIERSFAVNFMDSIAVESLKIWK